MNQIILGEAVKTTAKLPADSIDLTVTSPPFDDLFGLGDFDFDGLAKQLYRITKPGGIVAWNVQDRIIKGSQTCTSCRQQIKFREIGFNVHETLIAYSEFTNLPYAEFRYPRAWQYVFILSKGKPTSWHPIKDRPNVTAGTRIRHSTRDANTGKRTKGRRPDMLVEAYGWRSNVWKVKVGSASAKDKYVLKEHPAVMPEKLVEDLIVSYSNPGDVILDPFLGAGTTSKIALLNFRNYLGIEISRKFYRLAKRRMVDAERELRRRLDEWLAA